MAKAARDKASAPSPDKAKKQRKKQAKRETNVVLTVEQAQKRVQKAEQKLFKAQRRLQARKMCLPCGKQRWRWAFKAQRRLQARKIRLGVRQRSLGIAYYELPTGDRAGNLAQAIACYQEALRFLTPKGAPDEYAWTQSGLGDIYRDLPTGDQTANLHQAMACYQEALRVWTPEAEPFMYAWTQTHLGEAYFDLPTGDQATNLAQAITCFEEALRTLTPQQVIRVLESGSEFPYYAEVQLHLGIAYQRLLEREQMTNLVPQAITSYREALRVFTPEAAPFEYAMIQAGLGYAYNCLPTGDRLDIAKQAIACYQEALRVFTPETAPDEYAAIQRQLGEAYDSLPGEEARTQAIACYQEALRVVTPETAPEEYALIQIELGDAYRRLPGEEEANLAQALACFEEALRVVTPETAPRHYAMVQGSLGRVYLDSAYPELPTEDRLGTVKQAIACFEEALRFLTPSTAPNDNDYVWIQMALGDAYRLLGEEANLAQALACLEEALRFLTPEAVPSWHRAINRKLADLHFAQEEWHAALAAYRVAMEAGERLYRAGLSLDSKAAEMAETAALYYHAAFAAVRCGETTEALLMLERGKTRLLAEALRLRVPRPANIPDEVWTAFEQAGAAVRAAQVESPARSGVEHNPLQSYTVREQAAQAASTALEAAIERVRTYAPEFLHALDLPSIQALLPDERTVLIAFCITEQGSVGFVVGQHVGQEVQVIEVPTFTQTELRRLFFEWDADNRAVGGWLEVYMRLLMEQTQAVFETWQETMTQTLAQLGRHLLAPILSSLPSGIERIIFLPSAQLFLIPLQAVPLSEGDSDRVCDHYQVCYVPSMEVLACIRAKAARVTEPELYAVINPGADQELIFPSTERAIIAELFEKSDVDEGRAATKQSVLTGVEGRTYVHFACHGSYNLYNPAESGLDLADGRLTLAELQSGVMDLSTARLVTLSACETGITDVVQGSTEEYVSIPASFLLAGVPCVVSSLWAVPDNIATALLMERFYCNHLQGGMDIGAALREAQLWVRDLSVGKVAQYAEKYYRQSRWKDQAELFRLMRYYHYQAEHNPPWHPFAHPYYWAAFTVNGM